MLLAVIILYTKKVLNMHPFGRSLEYCMNNESIISKMAKLFPLETFVAYSIHNLGLYSVAM